MQQRKNNRGFSLIEILTVVAIASIVVLVVGNFSNSISGLDSLISGVLQSQSTVNAALVTMSKEIQSANFSANGAYPIDAAGTSTLGFYADIQKIGVYDHIRYFLASSSIYKGVIVPTGTPASYATSSEVITDVIDNVTTTASSAVLFSYYDSSYTGTQSPLVQPVSIAAIRLVGISFSVQATTTPSQASIPEYFSTLVDIRNLKSN